MTDLLDYLLEEYDKEGKTHVVIGIGCTGGQHRSVSLTIILQITIVKSIMFIVYIGMLFINESIIC